MPAREDNLLSDAAAANDILPRVIYDERREREYVCSFMTHSW